MGLQAINFGTGSLVKKLKIRLTENLVGVLILF
jgi:hypothetical protein